MRLLISLITAGLTVAQLDLSDVPECAASCIEQALPSVDCDPSDDECICREDNFSDFRTAALACIVPACDAAELTDVLASADQICNLTLNSTSTTTSPSSTARSSSRPTSLSTSVVPTGTPGSDGDGGRTTYDPSVGSGEGDGGSDNKAGVIAGSVIGALAAVLALIGVAWYIRRRRNKNHAMMEPPTSDSNGSGSSHKDNDIVELPSNHAIELPASEPLSPKWTGSPLSDLDREARRELVGHEVLRAELPGSECVRGFSPMSAEKEKEKRASARYSMGSNGHGKAWQSGTGQNGDEEKQQYRGSNNLVL